MATKVTCLFKKAPAATIQTLVEALKIVAQSVDHPVSVIGTRHGEKLYESLCSVEEMLVAEDQGSYFRIPPDIRDLNYSSMSMWERLNWHQFLTTIPTIPLD